VKDRLFLLLLPTVGFGRTAWKEDLGAAANPALRPLYIWKGMIRLHWIYVPFATVLNSLLIAFLVYSARSPAQGQSVFKEGRSVVAEC
jgi:hypothetical protein